MQLLAVEETYTKGRSVTGERLMSGVRRCRSRSGAKLRGSGPIVSRPLASDPGQVASPQNLTDDVPPAEGHARRCEPRDTIVGRLGDGRAVGDLWRPVVAAEGEQDAFWLSGIL